MQYHWERLTCGFFDVLQCRRVILDRKDPQTRVRPIITMSHVETDMRTDFRNPLHLLAKPHRRSAHSPQSTHDFRPGTRKIPCALKMTRQSHRCSEIWQPRVISHRNFDEGGLRSIAIGRAADAPPPLCWVLGQRCPTVERQQFQVAVREASISIVVQYESGSTLQGYR